MRHPEYTLDYYSIVNKKIKSKFSNLSETEQKTCANDFTTKQSKQQSTDQFTFYALK